MKVNAEKSLSFTTENIVPEKSGVKTKRPAKTEMKYQPENYRKTFKEQNVNRKRIRLFSNRVEPYQGCVDYFVSKKVIRKLRTPYNFENVTERNLLTSNTFSRIKLYQVENNLAEVRSEELKCRKILDKKWKDLHQKEINLKQSFIEFDQFIIQNEEKRERSIKKINQGKSESIEKTQQIEKLEKEYGQCKKLKELLDSGIKKHSHIERYLLEVVNNNRNSFSTIEDLLKRFEALLEARHILSNLFERYLTQMEEAKDMMDKMVMVKCVKIDGLRNTLADLHYRFETAQQTCSNWEQYHNKVVLEAMNKVMEIQSVKDSIWQIYQDICLRKGIQPVYEGNYGNQLEIIKKALLKFNLVNKINKKLESPNDEASSMCSSIVVNVAKKVSNKLEDKSKSLPRETTKHHQERKLDDKFYQKMFTVPSLTKNIVLRKLKDRKEDSVVANSRAYRFSQDLNDDNDERKNNSSADLNKKISKCQSLIDFETDKDKKMPNKLLINLKEKKFQNLFVIDVGGQLVERAD